MVLFMPARHHSLHGSRLHIEANGNFAGKINRRTLERHCRMLFDVEKVLGMKTLISLRPGCLHTCSINDHIDSPGKDIVRIEHKRTVKVVEATESAGVSEMRYRESNVSVRSVEFEGGYLGRSRETDKCTQHYRNCSDHLDVTSGADETPQGLDVREYKLSTDNLLRRLSND